MWLEPGFHEELIEIEASLTPSSSPNHSKRSRDHESDDSHWTSQLPSTSNSATMPTTPTSLTVQHSSLPASSSSQLDHIGAERKSGKGKARESDEVEGDYSEEDAAPLVPVSCLRDKVQPHIIPCDEETSEEITILRDHLADLLDVYLQACARRCLLSGNNLNPLLFQPNRVTSARQLLRGPLKICQTVSINLALGKVEILALAMCYLLEASSKMCFRLFTDDASHAYNIPELNKDPAFQVFMTELKSRERNGFAVHLKLEALKTLVTDHFGRRPRDDNASNAGVHVGEGTRAVVFVTFREAVDEIVGYLNQESPFLKATEYIGQGIDENRNLGITQQGGPDNFQQSFKDGVFNIVVATSVGEEGLNIGEVDLVVYYDAEESPIRMLQRVGRTGRKRKGCVHVLLAQGREETKWLEAQKVYNRSKVVFGELKTYHTIINRLTSDQSELESSEIVEIEEHRGSHGKKRKRDDLDDPAQDIISKIPRKV